MKSWGLNEKGGVTPPFFLGGKPQGRQEILDAEGLSKAYWLGTLRCVNYGIQMVEVIKSSTFDQWLKKLRDPRAKARIQMRIRWLGLGNPGDVRPIGEGLSEMRIDYGSGYRVYYLQQGGVLVVLLCGGDKRTQQRDIARAKSIAAEWKG